ncbi:MAG: hypothetical protein M1828_002125 [Chrysothrix sp. TS-e1954]|nr:MAG: hypothetical protein M1828_002125 [Chrysothrix sp. TS-e1954]
MVQSKKRKTPSGNEPEVSSAIKRQATQPLKDHVEDGQTNAPESVEDAEPVTTEPKSNAAPQTSQDRQARFKALQARNTESRTQNRKETAVESQRLSTDPSLINSLNRKQDIANHKLMKADAEAAGEDFERKRAWDWTVLEAEKWDKRMQKKEQARQNVAFQDYTHNAKKVYKHQVKRMGNPDVEAYEKEKREAIDRAAENGSLEVVETEDGELVAIDKDGAFYSTANSTDFASNKPSKESVDRLVADLQKADEIRMRKRRDRGKGEDEADVTYINDKNKQFNLKLKRFYDKYTVGVRESFERGTAL